MDTMPTAPIIERRNADAQQLETTMMLCWQDYKVADSARNDKGLSLGKACYELREQTKAQGTRDGSGFEAALDRIGISKPTAYRWIARYEESAGLRLTRDEVKPASTLQEMERDIEDAMQKLEQARKVAETVFSLTVPDYANGVTGISGDIELGIYPAEENGQFAFMEGSTYFWVSCWNAGNEMLSHMKKPIRKDGIHLALSMFWAEIGPGAPKPHSFAWRGVQ